MISVDSKKRQLNGLFTTLPPDKTSTPSLCTARGSPWSDPARGNHSAQPGPGTFAGLGVSLMQHGGVLRGGLVQAPRLHVILTAVAAGIYGLARRHVLRSDFASLLRSIFGTGIPFILLGDFVHTLL